LTPSAVARAAESVQQRVLRHERHVDARRDHDDRGDEQERREMHRPMITR